MAQSDDNFDDQTLGSFVDGRLDAAHNEKIIKAMEDDPEVRERAYQFRRAKDLMRLGFGEASAPSGHTAKARFRHWKLFSPEIAVSITALAVAFGAGMLGCRYYYEPVNDLSGQAVALTSQPQPEKVILHVSGSNRDLE